MDMDLPAYSIPQCSNLQIIINRAALGLLMNPGTAVSSPVLHTLDAYGSAYYMHLKGLSKEVLSDSSDYKRLAAYYVYSGIRVEYVFLLVRCGRCEVCRHAKQIDMVNRCRMESSVYDCPPYMITLTYDDNNLPCHRPECRRRGILSNSLYYKDIQDFFKRLRIRWSRAGLSHDIRYLVAGEYGSKRGRPHYHIILWNNPYHTGEYDSPYSLHRTQHVINHRRLQADVYAAWGRSSSLDAFQCEPALDGAAAYCTKYMSKIATTARHGFYLQGKRPPFIRCSNRHGGIGAPCVERYRYHYMQTPQADVFRYLGIDGQVVETPITGFISQKLWPSSSRQVPAAYRRLYTSLIDVCHKAYEYKLLTLKELKETLNYYRVGCLFYKIQLSENKHDTNCLMFKYAQKRIADCYNHVLDEMDIFEFQIDTKPHDIHRLSVVIDDATISLAYKNLCVNKLIALNESKERL